MKKYFLLLLLLLFSQTALAKVKINEILPNPDGQDKNGEWIELFNDSKETSLAGWILKDKVGQTRTFIFPATTTISSFLLCPISQTKITLNNDHDIIELLSPDGLIQDRVEYQSSQSGVSFSKTNGNNWFWDRNPTPNQPNHAPEIKETTSSPAFSKPEQSSPLLTFCIASLVALGTASGVFFLKKS